MSENRTLLLATAERLFAEDASLQQISEAGLPLLLVPEAEGGFGGDWGDAFAVLGLAGRHAVERPVAEAVVAGAVAARAGLSLSEAAETLCWRAQGQVVDGRFTGRLPGAPWGRQADTVLFELEGGTWRVRTADAVEAEEAETLAGEPRATLAFEDAEVARGGPSDILLLTAFARSAQIAGALDATLEMSIEYANARHQFGRPIAKFQAVQQSLAVFAEEAAAVNAAGQAAAIALDRGDADLEIAAARFTANRAAEIGAATAHQVHGAIGFTEEYALHRLTRRLLAWRSEHGSDASWAERLGRRVAALGPEGLWAEITRRSDPVS
jgi:acyl-CoA dehydrogenase